MHIVNTAKMIALSPKRSCATHFQHRLLPLVCTMFVMMGVKADTASTHLSEEQWRDFNLATVNHYIIPKYAELALSANALNAHAIKLCDTLSEADHRSSQQAYRTSLQKWQAIQNVRFGPAEISMRHHAMQFWPDKKNHIGKRLHKLLTQESELTTENLLKAPVSVKGLPAIERLLFGQDAFETLVLKQRHCQALVMITQSVLQMSRDMHDEWRQEMLSQFEDAKQLDGYFEDDIDAATTLLKALMEPMETMRDLKIVRPAGSSAQYAKYKRLESWRSGQSLANLKTNTDSLESFYRLNDQKNAASLRSLLTPEHRKQIDSLFEQVNASLQAVPSPLESHLETEAGHRAVLALAESLDTLNKGFERILTEMGIHLGFNSRDGD